MNRALFLPIALTTSFSANAGWSNWSTVTTYHVNADPARVYISGPSITDVGCTADTTPTILFEGSQATDNAKELYSTMLAAFLAGKEVRVYANTCWSAYSTPIVNALEIR